MKAGVRLASSVGATSTNETMDDDFESDIVCFDRAYINWQPLESVELMGSKIAQPWEQVSSGLI